MAKRKKWCVNGLLISSLVFLSFLLGFWTPVIAGQPAPTLSIVFLDLTTSTPPSEHQANVAFLRKVLSTFDPGRVMVFAISDATFSNPILLLDQEIPPPDENDSFFNTKQIKARQALMRTWDEIAPQLKPTYRWSDVLGAVCLAARYFKNWRGNKVLVMISDMRHATPPINIEKGPEVKPAILEKVTSLQLVPKLSGVQVQVLGVHTHKKDPPYLGSLENFWKTYFEETGATLINFTPLRDMQFRPQIISGQSYPVASSKPSKAGFPNKP